MAENEKPVAVPVPAATILLLRDAPGGLEVFMVHTGEKKLKGRPAAQDPMKTYDFHIGKGPQKLIPIIEDTREKSSGEKSMFDVKAKPGSTREPGDDSDDDDMQF